MIEELLAEPSREWGHVPLRWNVVVSAQPSVTLVSSASEFAVSHC